MIKPSKNAFFGYTYQQCIALLILAKMDTERKIEQIEIEAFVENNFDDITIQIENYTLYCQIKDIENISLDNVIISDGNVSINGKSHKLSDGDNILFFKNIDITSNSQILDLQAYKISNLYILSLSRNDAENIMSNLFRLNGQRAIVIRTFLDNCLDKRRLIIKKEDLPTIDTYNIHLLEQTIDVGKKHLEFEHILFIEGKPGVGKSHLVTCFSNEYKKHLIYRFWVSNQDKDYQSRLKFQNFLANISKELFQDYKYRTEKEIINKISDSGKIVIIDGLDHIENYNNTELPTFIDFIEKLKENCRVIVLSRPLKANIQWKKQILENWNFEETKKVLGELYHITDYKICQSIFDLTSGYPILVRFVAEHYKTNKKLPSLTNLSSTDDYYSQIISNVNTATALTLFLSSRSFFMESEIALFLEDELATIVKEFIATYPYLFECRLNRISLFHDSFTTFLRNKNIDYSARSAKIKQKVYESLMNEEKRFMSRFAFYDLDKTQKIEIAKKYSSMDCFQRIMQECVDFEAIRSFYKQIRESLAELEATDFEITHYYDLSLIINITARDQVSTINEFLYTYVKCLLFNGYSDDDITSSEHLFCTYYYYKTNDASLLYNLMADAHYDTEYFYQKLEYDARMEENYFDRHQNPLQKSKQLRSFLNQELMMDSYEYVPHILANLYLHETNIEKLKGLQSAVKTYLDIDNNLGIFSLEKALVEFKNLTVNLSRNYLAKAKDIILSLGKDICSNEYHANSLKELILNNSNQGSFAVWPKVLNYIRLSVYEKRKIDLSSINIFWTMYYQRKDYTVFTIDEALKIFEDKGLISIDKSIEIIVFTQKMSEKGIRHLLTDYIELHTPEIIPHILKKFHPDNLQITWFDLPSEFINGFSDILFNYALYQQLFQWNRYNKKIEYKDVKNILYSKKKQKFIDEVKFLKYHIKITKGDAEIKFLKGIGCPYYIEESSKQDEYKNPTVEESYNKGILKSESIEFIKKRKLNIAEIAGYTDGWYSVLADIDIFKAYDTEIVKENILPILHNAIIGKIGSINMFASLWHTSGNIPKLLQECNTNFDYNTLFDSFMKFLEISLLLPND